MVESCERALCLQLAQVGKGAGDAMLEYMPTPLLVAGTFCDVHS